MEQQLTQQLNKAKSVLLVPDSKFDLDALAALFGLAISLKSSGKKVSMYIAPEVYTETVKAKFPPQNMRFLKEDEPGTYLITLDNMDSAIKEVKWKEEQGKVNIYITTEKGNITKEKITINQTGGKYDLIIGIGLQNPETLGSFYSSHKHGLTKENTFLIQQTPAEGSKYSTVKMNLSSYSHFVHNFLAQNSIEINSDTATNLLAGIYWKTNNYRVANEDTFAVSTTLIGLGADQEQGRNIANQTISFVGSGYFSDLYGNIKTSGKGLFYSVVPESKLIENGKREVLFREYVPISNIIGCKIAFVIIHGKSENKVYIQANSDSKLSEENIQNLQNKYQARMIGDLLEFESDTDVTKLQEQLIAELMQILGGEIKKEEKPETEQPEIKKQAETSQAKPEAKPESAPIRRKFNEPEPQIQDEYSPATPSPNADFLGPQTETQVTQTKQQETPNRVSGLPTSTTIAPTEPKEEKYQVTPTSSNGDPLAAAENIPEPLDLEGKKNEPAPMTAPAPSSPLPPASI